MEFWILILTVWAFYRWVQSRIHRQKDDERFVRVVEDLHNLETRAHDREPRLTTTAPPAPIQQPAAPAPPPADPKPIEPPISIKLPPTLEIPKPPTPVASP